MVQLYKEMSVGGQWLLMDKRTIHGKDSLFEELIYEHGSVNKDKVGSTSTTVDRRFHGDTIKVEGLFTIRGLLNLSSAWKQHRNNPRTDFGCFPFDYIDQFDEDLLALLKTGYAIDSVRMIAWVI